MPVLITIPISIFELTILYERPEIRLLADKTRAVEGLFTAFAPWNPSVDDIELLTSGKPSEQGVKIKIPNQGASFFFGPTSCKFTKDPATWPEADQTLQLLSVALEALGRSTGVTFGKRTSVLSLHLQPTIVSFRDILRKFIVPELLALDPGAPTVMAVVARWPTHRVTLDGSATLANGIFLQAERGFDGDATFENIKEAIFSDEQELFKLLDVQEDAS